ncbi:hypothetical protein PCC7424_1809 [Gloeothece citriformis PCC 7424]|uniref:Uncharacterized protein n=1 Tax=Gloeothece citriformis (strain PCC 7424) TaxID=65393 RepID=B7KCD6_GLOC7|nr:hypothetical protein [Gloeothece citriformis]ACK70241.1 hypothetical protein PCC7424_1809 [Gloeothece citriformis PCC 7424]
MMKTKLSLSAILGAVALTSGVLFANPATAEPCSLMKGWKKNFSVTFNQLNPTQQAFLRIGGVAALAGAGWLVAKKIKGTTDTSSSASNDFLNETSFPIHVPPEALETIPLEVEEEEVSSHQPTSKG